MPATATEQRGADRRVACPVPPARGVSCGKAISSTSVTSIASTKGQQPRNIVRRPMLGNRLLSTNRFMPTGGEIRPICTIITTSTPNQTGSKPSAMTMGKNSGIVNSTMVSSSITVPSTT